MELWLSAYLVRNFVYLSMRNYRVNAARFIAGKSAFLILILSAPALSFSQATTSIFAPFVSHLEARTNPPATITLTWTDSPSVKGPVFIYRAKSEFIGQPPREALCGEAAYGKQTWTDTIPNQGTAFYFVASADENRIPFLMIVPNHNMVEIVLDGTARMAQAAGFSAPVKNAADLRPQVKVETAAAPKKEYTTPKKEDTAQRAETPPPRKTAPPVTQTATITGISALPEGTHIRVTFLQLMPSKNAVVYRNIVPITSPANLLSADVVHLPGARSPVMDTAKPGVPYYYAVLYDEDIRAGAAVLIPGQNSTLYPALLYPPQPAAPQAAPPSKLSIEAEAALSRTGSLSSYTQLAPAARSPAPVIAPAASAPPVLPQAVTPALTAPSAQGMLSGPPVSTQMAIPDPQVFQQDLLAYPAGTDEYRLAAIVQTAFTWRNWQRSIPELQALINAASITNQVHSISSDIVGRARFYLGQAMFFFGNYSAALTEFLAVQSRFQVETGYWIQLSISRIGTL